MNTVIAPKGGYDFKEKGKYRNKIWKGFSDNVDNISTAKVAFFPSKEGLEIPVALKLGFKESNLYAIDKSPQMVSHAHWRKAYPNIHIYCSDITRASERLVKDNVKLDAVNMDLCGTFSRPTIDNFSGFIRSGCMKDDAVIAMTMFSGREQKDMTALIKKHGPRKQNSILAMVRMLFSHYKQHSNVSILNHGEYRTESKSTKMLWLVANVKDLNSNKVNDLPLYPKRKTDTIEAKEVVVVSSFGEKIMDLVKEEVLNRVETETKKIMKDVLNEVFTSLKIKDGVLPVSRKNAEDAIISRDKLNSIIKYNGVERKLSEWATIYKMRSDTLARRILISSTYTIHEAMTKPVNQAYSRIAKKTRKLSTEPPKYNGKLYTWKELGEISPVCATTIRYRFANGMSLHNAVTLPNQKTK